VPGFWDHPVNYFLQSHLSRLDHGGMSANYHNVIIYRSDPIFPRYFLFVTSREWLMAYRKDWWCHMIFKRKVRRFFRQIFVDWRRLGSGYETWFNIWPSKNLDGLYMRVRRSAKGKSCCMGPQSALAVVLWYYTRLISERSPVQFPAGRTKNFSLHTAAVTSPTAW
jgi:hypothetical protein